MRYPLLMITFVIVATSTAHADLSKQKPVRAWLSWVKAMQMPKPIRPVSNADRIFKRFTKSEWRIARVAIMLEQLAGNCDDVTYQGLPLDHAAADAVAHGPYWLSLSGARGHKQKTATEKLQIEVNAAYEKHGEALCKYMYARLGKNGDLIKHFKRLTKRSRFNQRQVLWRSRDICSDPEGFWFEPGIKAEYVQPACESAEKFRDFWGE